jgi:hypothetical protein
MPTLLTQLVYHVVAGLLYYCVTLLFPWLPTPIPLIVQILFVLIVIMLILSAFGMVGGGLPQLRI